SASHDRIGIISAKAVSTIRASSIHAYAESLGFASPQPNLYHRWARHAVPLQSICLPSPVS
ncbi:MAG: hypothetical protein LBL72_06350, partial [Candidatus Accumulibacter sp.]|nr:hypothetical protein [Accumulibacter sp.]